MAHDWRAIIFSHEPVSVVTEPDIIIIGVFDNSRKADAALFRELQARVMTEEKRKKK